MIPYTINLYRRARCGVFDAYVEISDVDAIDHEPMASMLRLNREVLLGAYKPMASLLRLNSGVLLGAYFRAAESIP